MREWAGWRFSKQRRPTDAFRSYVPARSAAQAFDDLFPQSDKNADSASYVCYVFLPVWTLWDWNATVVSLSNISLQAKSLIFYFFIFTVYAASSQ